LLFSLFPFPEPSPKKRLPTFCQLFGQPNTRTTGLSATTTGSGCVSPKPEWGQNFLEQGVLRDFYGCQSGRAAVTSPQCEAKSCLA
jgi:hypothetical protein